MSNYRIRRVRSGDHVSSDFLMHYGISGMKWGVRRFQNEDGSLTTEGKIRYGYSSDKHLQKGINQMEKRIAKSESKRQKLIDKTVKKAYADFDKNVKSKNYTNDPEIRDIYAMERVDKLDALSRQNNSGGELEKDKKTLSELKRLQTRTTNMESEFSRSSVLMSQDKKAMKEINSIIDSNPKEFEAISESAKEYGKAVEDLDASYWKLEKQLYNDRGKEWDGDGTELHEELYRRYPEYKKVADREQSTLKKFVEDAKDASKSDLFNKSNLGKQYQKFFDEYDSWFRSGDPKAYAIAVAIWKKTNNENRHMDFFPEYFIDSYDKKGNKLQSPYF